MLRLQLPDTFSDRACVDCCCRICMHILASPGRGEPLHVTGGIARGCCPSGPGLLRLLLLLLLLLLKLFLMRAICCVLLCTLRLLGGCFLLPGLDFRLMLGTIPLLGRKAFRLVLAFLCVLHAARGGIGEVLLVIRLLAIEGSLVLCPLRRFCIPLRRGQLVLALLLGKRFLARLLARRALRRFGRVLRAFDPGFLVPLLP